MEVRQGWWRRQAKANKDERAVMVVGNDSAACEPEGTERQIVGAAAVGGIAGLVVAGPVIALVAAGGAAAIATSKSQAGQVLRSGGDVISDAGERLKKFDEQFHISKKAGESVAKGVKWTSNQISNKESR